MSRRVNRNRHHVIGGAVAALLVVVAGLTGCGKGPGAASDDGPLSLYTDNPTWADGFQKVGAELKKITGRDLNSRSLPSTANYTEVVQSSLNTKKPGDIVKWWDGKQLEKLAATGKITDLTAVWEGAVKKGWLDDTLRPFYSYNGKVYAVPMSQGYETIFYSKTIFQKYGLRPPKTYDEFKAIATKLKAHGVTPLWTGQADGWTSFIPYQTLIGAISPDFYTRLSENKASFGDPESRQALQLWQEWMKKGWVTPPDSKMTETASLMKAGKVAMFPVGTWAGQLLKAGGLTPGTDYGAFFMPPMSSNARPAIFTVGAAFTVPKNAPNHDAAVKQLEAWLDPRVQKVWSDYLGDSSPNPTVQPSDPVVKDLVDQVAASKPLLLNRYFESLPPTLVQDSTSTLAGFMVHPDTLSSVISGLTKAEAKDWADWKQQQ